MVLGAIPIRGKTSIFISYILIILYVMLMMSRYAQADGIGEYGFISVDSNPSTGCKWVCSVKDEEVAKVVKEFFIEDIDSILNFKNPGKDGKNVFIIKGQNPGTTIIEIDLVAPGTEEITETLVYSVVVFSNHDVKLKKLPGPIPG